MDYGKFNETLGRIFLDVLEQHAFLLPEPRAGRRPDKMPGEGMDYLQIEMSIYGALSGCLVLLLPAVTSAEIEKNLTGGPEQDGGDKERDGDGAKEMLNIIGAKAVSAILGDAASFDISVPVAKPFRAADWNYFDGLPVRAELLVDGQPVFLFFDPKEITTKEIG